MFSLNRVKNEQGTTLVEFTVILTILFALTFGMIDIGRYVYAVSAIGAAAQAGARFRLRQDGRANLADTETVVKESLVAFDTTNITISVGQPTQETVEVEVTYQFKFITPLLAPMFPGNILEIVGGASMVIY
jgi:Flp pilus assembly protein TadG